MTLLEILALLALGGIAGFINVLSAGGSMLTLPLLMFLGLPPQVANGTNRVAITLQSITAVGSFHRMGHGKLMVSLRLAVPAVLGSLLGAWVATWVPDAVLVVVLVSAMIGASVFMLLPQPNLDTRPLTVDRLSPAIYLAMFFVGMYGGFIQVGVGVLFIVVLYHMLKIDLRQVNVLKFTEEGYAGMLPNGNIVDRREQPDAVPMQKNNLLNVPEPKGLPPKDKA